MRKKRDDALVISENEKLIIISMAGPRYNGFHFGEECYDANEIEINYREDDENGWGVGGDEYISTTDIKKMADCIRSVLFCQKDTAHYACKNDTIRIAISFREESGTYSFTVALIETLEREYHITITKNDLPLNALEEYIAPFFAWEKQYPIVPVKE